MDTGDAPDSSMMSLVKLVVVVGFLFFVCGGFASCYGSRDSKNSSDTAAPNTFKTEANKPTVVAAYKWDATDWPDGEVEGPAVLDFINPVESLITITPFGGARPLVVFVTNKTETYLDGVRVKEWSQLRVGQSLYIAIEGATGTVLRCDAYNKQGMPAHRSQTLSGKSAGLVNVKGYTTKNGAQVAPHTRNAPGGGRRGR